MSQDTLASNTMLEEQSPVSIFDLDWLKLYCKAVDPMVNRIRGDRQWWWENGQQAHIFTTREEQNDAYT